MTLDAIEEIARNQRMVRYKKTYLIAFIILLPTFIQYEWASGNPIPRDHYYSATPFSSTYNGSVVFESEHINITFEDAKAYISANYTFRNVNDTACNLTILLPFHNAYYHKPNVSELLANENNISYKWKNMTESLFNTYENIFWYNEFYLIEFNLTFNAYEKKDVIACYSRDYVVYNYESNPDIRHIYRYFVGSLKIWNHTIDKAEFNFWVPKELCDNIQEIQEYWYPDHLGNNTSNITEYENYYFLSVKYENWTLPYSEYDGYYHFIQISWKEKKDQLAKLFYTLAIYGIFIAAVSSCVILIYKKAKT